MHICTSSDEDEYTSYEDNFTAETEMLYDIELLDIILMLLHVSTVRLMLSS